MKKGIVLFVVPIILFICSCDGKKLSHWEHFQGVWANDNCELIRTANYSLMFSRKGSVITSTLREVTVEGSSIDCNTRAKAIFDQSDHSVTLKAKDLFNEDVVIRHLKTNHLQLDHKTYSLEKKSGTLLLLDNGHLAEELDYQDKTLKMKRSDNRWETLFLIETIEITDPYDMPKTVTKNTIGQRLLEWRLGTRYWEDPNSVFWKIDIGTNKHLYTFTMNSDFLYCRAARIRSNNHGTVFSQNIRLVVRGENRNKGYIGYMADNNLDKAGSELKIENDKFNKVCGIVYDKDIYWSLHSFEEDEIKVNGCDRIYERHPSNKDDDNMLEWIVFKKY